jgi:putative aldouronate transport system substrate-binding protein
VATETPKPKIKVSWAAWIDGPMDKDNFVTQLLAKTFPDVEFDLIGLERDTWVDQINTRVAGGDIPDIIYRDWIGYVRDYVSQGVLAEVPIETIKQYAPNYYKAIVDFGAETFLACNVEGKNYGLPTLTSGNSTAATNAWRKDWLTKVGIDKVPETLDEMEAAFVKFVNDDPDGNGQKDTYGVTARGKDSGPWLRLFDEVYAAYGLFPDQWCLESDGTVKLGVTTQRGKQVLTLLNKWYNEGLIDPEFVTTDDAIFQQKWANSKMGYMQGTWYRFIPSGDYYDNLMAATPTAIIQMGPAPKGPDGKYGYRSWGNINSSICFGKQLAADQPKLDRVLQVLDTIFTDPTLFTPLFHGQEGVHYKLDANGRRVAIPPYDDASKRGPIGTVFFSSMPAIPSLAIQDNEPNYQELTKYAVDRTTLDNQDYFTWVSLFQNADVVKAAANAQTVAAKWMIDFITGAKPMTEFDTFLAEWNAAGGDKLTQDANDAYKKGQSGLQSIKDSIK